LDRLIPLPLLLHHSCHSRDWGMPAVHPGHALRISIYPKWLPSCPWSCRCLDMEIIVFFHTQC
jgi:hypothetical protein